MGCTTSGCMTNTQSEIEVKLKNGNSLTQEIGKMKLDYKQAEPFVLLKDHLNPLPQISSPNPLRNKLVDGEEGKSQFANDQKEFGPATDGRGSYNNKTALELNLDDLQFRYGKTIEELDLEYEMILKNFSNARKELSVNHQPRGDKIASTEERIADLFIKWKAFVYDEISKKTGEIKNFVSFGSGGRTFRILHEVNGWKDVNLLRVFCENIKLSIDMTFFNELRSKIESIGSLTVHVWIEVSDAFQEQITTVGFNLTKPSDKRLIEKFLSNSAEKANILTWFDANTPVPIEYGFGVSDEGNRNELMVGFYFFDGPLNANLGRSLTAFQAYGAELSRKMIEIFRALPGEEYKVYFVISPEGVQKVRMIINRISENLEHTLLEQISKGYDLEAWKRFKKLFASVAAKNSYFLEYTNDGFELFCVTEVGGEITSRIYIEDH